jgi:hypothetical protein
MRRVQKSEKWFNTTRLNFGYICGNMRYVSLYRPLRSLGLRGVKASAFSDIRLIDGGKVVSPTRRPLFTPQEDSWY